MKKKIKNLILCGMMVCALMFGCFPDMALAEEKGIVISNVTSNSATFDWTSWANEHDYLSYWWSIMSEAELAGKDPYNVETYYDGVFTSKTVDSTEYCKENTKYYVCVKGSYFDWSEMEDFSEGKEELQAVFAQFTTSGSKKSNVKLNKKTASLVVGEKTTIKLKGVALSKQSFKSSNKKIAKVSSKGVVTALKKGTCKITVTNKATKKRYTCKVTVAKKKSSKDFLSQHGLTITPNGDATVQLAIGAGDDVTDDVEDVTIKTSVLTLNVKDNYVTDSFEVTFPMTETGNTYNISAFDRYTGTSFESVASNLDNGSVNTSGVIVTVDGKEYDCALNAAVYEENGECTVLIEVTHPAEYNGVVFEFGQQTKSQMAAYNAIDFSSTFTIADYADVFIDGQTFFTVSGK